MNPLVNPKTKILVAMLEGKQNHKQKNLFFTLDRPQCIAISRWRRDSLFSLNYIRHDDNREEKSHCVDGS